MGPAADKPRRSASGNLAKPWADAPLPAGSTVRTTLLCLAAVLAACSAISRTLHLGRPQFAHRAILGIRHSWLSREIAAFGTCIPLCFLSAALSRIDSAWLNLSLIAAAMSGLAGVMASAMIYHVPHRPFWNVVSQQSSVSTAAAAAFPHEFACRDAYAVGMDGRHASLVETSLLLTTRLPSELRLQAVGQVMFLLMAVILISWPVGTHVSLFAGLAVIAAVGAEFAERYLFFRAVVPLRMPGVIKS